MEHIKVETNELLAFSSSYQNLVNNFDSICSGIISKVESYNDFWKGSFTSDMSDKVKTLKTVQKEVKTNGNSLCKFVNEAVQKYIDVDRRLADASSINNKDYPSNVKVSVHVKDQTELDKIYNESFEAANRMPKNTNGTISCVALTSSKAQASGFTPDWSGNGKDVFANIREGDHGNYVAEKYPGGNCLNDLINKKGNPVTDIIISFPQEYGGGNKWGHVIYIDQIVDGKVYFTDNRSAKTGTVCSLEEFFVKYKSNGTPNGCVHLEKK